MKCSVNRSDEYSGMWMGWVIEGYRVQPGDKFYEIQRRELGLGNRMP